MTSCFPRLLPTRRMSGETPPAPHTQSVSISPHHQQRHTQKPEEACLFNFSLGYTSRLKAEIKSRRSDDRLGRVCVCSVVVLSPVIDNLYKLSSPNMPSQRQYFLSSFFAAFRPQPSLQQQNKQASSSSTATASTNPTVSAASAANNNRSSTPPRSLTSAATTAAAGPRTIAAAAAAARNNAVTIHSPRAGAGIPIPHNHNRRRGSDSSSEGFRDAIGAEKWYIGGKGVTGDETFFKLGVVRRVKSNDGLSLDRLSL